MPRTDEQIEAAIDATATYMAKAHPGVKMPPREELRHVWRIGIAAADAVAPAPEDASGRHLTPAEHAPPADGWRPIASAPLNATEVWLGTKTQVLLGYYSATGHKPVGWYSSDSNFPIGWAPTHWQPHVVPAPPED